MIRADTGPRQWHTLASYFCLSSSGTIGVHTTIPGFISGLGTVGYIHGTPRLWTSSAAVAWACKKGRSPGPLSQSLCFVKIPRHSLEEALT